MITTIPQLTYVALVGVQIQLRLDGRPREMILTTPKTAVSHTEQDRVTYLVIMTSQGVTSSCPHPTTIPFHSWHAEQMTL